MKPSTERQQSAVRALPCAGRWLASILVLAALWLSGQSYASVVSQYSFGQLNWFDGPTLVTANSSWGEMNLDLAPDPTATFYLNVVGDAGSGSAWIVRNYPVFPSTVGGSSLQKLYFDLTDLGVSLGTRLSTLGALVTLDASPLSGAPSGPLVASAVDSVDRVATGHGDPLPAVVEPPFGHKADAAVTKLIQHSNVPSVQENINNCMTGSFARSIKWLDNMYDLENLPNDTTAQAVYDVLNGMGIGHGSDKKTTDDEAQYLALKASYLKRLDGKAVTKLLKVSDYFGPNVRPPGVQLVTGIDLIDFLYRELRTEDVEFLYDSHAITITGIYMQGTKTFLRYRDDDHQSNPVDNVGDQREKDGELTLVNGKYFFNGARGRVDYVVSESIPEPTGLALLLVGLAALATVRCLPNSQRRVAWL